MRVNMVEICVNCLLIRDVHHGIAVLSFRVGKVSFFIIIFLFCFYITKTRQNEESKRTHEK